MPDGDHVQDSLLTGSRRHPEQEVSTVAGMAEKTIVRVVGYERGDILYFGLTFSDGTYVVLYGADIEGDADQLDLLTIGMISREECERIDREEERIRRLIRLAEDKRMSLKIEEAERSTHERLRAKFEGKGDA